MTVELDTMMGEVDASLPAGATPFDRAHLLAVRFEALLAPESVKSHGAVYTPRFIADRVVADCGVLFADRVVTSSTDYERSEGPTKSIADAADLSADCTPVAVPTICDPACGSGVFLVAAAAWLCAEFDLPLVEALGHHVRGLDVSPDALRFARATVEGLLRWSSVSESRSREVAATVVIQADALLLPLPDLRALLFGVGPDIVVGNPPYVKLQNLEPAHRVRLLDAYAGLATGSFSLSSLFLVRCLELVGYGVCGLITQNNVFTSVAARAVRRHLKERRAILRIVDFNHRKVFPGASAYTCLLYLGGAGCDEFAYAAVHDDDIEAALSGLDWSMIGLPELGASKWRLGARTELDNVQRIEAAGTSLRELCDIHVGFATLYDRAFVLEPGEDGWAGSGPEGRWPVEVDASRPFYKVSALDGAQDLVSARRRVLFPYDGEPGRWTLLAWEDLVSRWPGAARHLLRWREALLARDKGKRPGDQWYAWGRRQSFDAPGPKLLTRTFNRAPGFVLDPSDALFCNGYSVAPRPGGPLTAAGLGTLLNSRVMHYYACATSFHIQGGYQCYQKNFIETFTVPPLSAALTAALEAGQDGLDEEIAAAYGVKMDDIVGLLSRYHASG